MYGTAYNAMLKSPQIKSGFVLRKQNFNPSQKEWAWHLVSVTAVLGSVFAAL
jgi:hypothetical protein